MAKERGGARENAGRKPKADEEKANTIFLNALKEVYSAETDDEAKKEFVKDLLTFERGKIFISEHIFGKPNQAIDMTSNGEQITPFSWVVKDGSST